ncbi:DUF29 family protein [Thiocapsa sp.]|uniref:DUF29 family protein n=1 Tax=Thiocapsa sp. TaxID=2024551 RepID=UPI003445479B
MPTMADLYRGDFCAWVEAQAALLGHGRLQDIDSDLLAEELEAIGRRERNALNRVQSDMRKFSFCVWLRRCPRPQ